MIDGKKNYDFGVDLITDYAKAGKIPFQKDEMAFRINFKYSGELPGTATIRIPVDKKWEGKTLYYHLDEGNGKFKFQQKAVVTNGVYTITQKHCSDYVAATKELKAPTKPGNGPTPPAKGDPTSPKTGDTAPILGLFAMLACAGVGVVGYKRKWFA